MENILIIDDDAKLTELLIEFLGSHKFIVIAKHTPEEGLEYLVKNKIKYGRILFKMHQSSEEDTVIIKDLEPNILPSWSITSTRHFPIFSG